jgi:hypothetical protein
MVLAPFGGALLKAPLTTLSKKIYQTKSSFAGFFVKLGRSYPQKSNEVRSQKN